jgi:monovalent cation:H+ antiporter, CPA1 family
VEQFLQTETLIIELLLVVSLVAMAVRRLRVPYTIALVVAGLVITFQQPVTIDLAPALIMALFVPPLVFEAALHINVRLFLHNLPAIVLLAVPGVILTTLIVAAILSLGAAIALPAALVFGALISATDPVSVVATFRALNIPKRLGILVEAESLLNDGTAIVTFGVMLAIALAGRFDLVSSAFDFVRVSVGGLVTGLVLGWAVSLLIARIDDYLIETTLTTILAFGSYLIADRLGFSGVLAVVVAGLVNGNLGLRGMSPTTRIVLFNFWEYVAFLANSLVFLLIGLQVNVPALLANWQPVLMAILAVLASRVVVVYGLSWGVNRFLERIPLSWQHVLSWGGLRGAVSLALALSLPAELGAQRDLLRVMAFGVVLFTLIVQGATMRPLLVRLGLVGRGENELDYERRHARLTALRIAAQRLDDMHRDGLLSTPTWEGLKSEMSGRLSDLAAQVREALHADPNLEATELLNARRELLRAQRVALMGLLADSVISGDVFEELSAEIDAALMGGDRGTEPGEEPGARASAIDGAAE